MRIFQISCRTVVAVCLAIVPSVYSASAVELEITVTSQQPDGGFSVTPVWFGFSDGSFQAFTSDAAAGADIQAVAEFGDTGPISTDFQGHGVQTVLQTGAGPFLSGSSATTMVNISDPSTDRFLNFAAMVVPSNDLFVGNENGIALFDSSGIFLGPQTITLTGSNIWDAGTEVNNIADHPAFILGVDAHGGARENGTVGLFLNRPDATTYLSTILGQTTAANYEISHLFSATDTIATITIQAVPEPSTWGLLAIGGAAIVMTRRCRRHTCNILRLLAKL